MADDASAAALWTSGNSYERYVGRWSRPVAREFLAWLGAPPRARWLDVGCGTGALTETILATQAPTSVKGIDPSEPFVGFAREHVRDARVSFAVGRAEALECDAASVDAVVSGLALNFVPDPEKAALEFARVLHSGGIAGAYVWDYAGEMQMMRHFWDAAVALDPGAADLDEARRCSICNPESLSALWRAAGIGGVEVRAIDAVAIFANFDDYWEPFLGGRAPAPAYAMSLSDDRRTALRESLRQRLSADKGGVIRLVTRAWAVKGAAP